MKRRGCKSLYINTLSLSFPIHPCPRVFLSSFACVYETPVVNGEKVNRQAPMPGFRQPHQADAPGGAVSVPNDSGGTSVPGTETNGMQGPLIPFCGQCGRELEPQKVRRGVPRQFCSAACRVLAWRRRDAERNTQNTQNSGPPSVAGNSVYSVHHLDGSGPRLQSPIGPNTAVSAGAVNDAEDPSASREVVGAGLEPAS